MTDESDPSAAVLFVFLIFHLPSIVQWRYSKAVHCFIHYKENVLSSVNNKSLCKSWKSSLTFYGCFYLSVVFSCELQSSEENKRKCRGWFQNTFNQKNTDSPVIYIEQQSVIMHSEYLVFNNNRHLKFKNWMYRWVMKWGKCGTVWNSKRGNVFRCSSLNYQLYKDIWCCFSFNLLLICRYFW